MVVSNNNISKEISNISKSNNGCCIVSTMFMMAVQESFDVSKPTLIMCV